MITNTELTNRFDVYYNNITSSQAPGLDEYEKSVFFNKAQREVLKNHLNPKGNKYGEGFDFSSKRQLEFAPLIKVSTYLFGVEPGGTLSPKNWACSPVDTENVSPSMLSIINESVETLSGEAAKLYLDLVNTLCAPVAANLDFDGNGVLHIQDVSVFVDKLNNGLQITKEAATSLLNVLYQALGAGNVDPVEAIVASGYTVGRVLDESGVSGTIKTVVPINNVEYDTLMSRPYKYPPRQQVWRLFVNGTSEFILGPDEVPIRYRVRYVRIPREVKLDSDAETDSCELPDFLIDEVLQRAVELAKAAYLGDMNHQQLIATMGERSE